MKFGVKYLCGHECDGSSVPITINAKGKTKNDLGGIKFTLISVATVLSSIPLITHDKMNQDVAQKSVSQPPSQPGRHPESDPHRQEKVPEWSSGASAENHPQSLLESAQRIDFGLIL